jgi:hypothetical protein
LPGSNRKKRWWKQQWAVAVAMVVAAAIPVRGWLKSCREWLGQKQQEYREQELQFPGIGRIVGSC